MKVPIFISLVVYSLSFGVSNFDEDRFCLEMQFKLLRKQKVVVGLGQANLRGDIELMAAEIIPKNPKIWLEDKHPGYFLAKGRGFNIDVFYKKNGKTHVLAVDVKSAALVCQEERGAEGIKTDCKGHLDFYGVTQDNHEIINFEEYYMIESYILQQLAQYVKNKIDTV